MFPVLFYTTGANDERNRIIHKRQLSGLPTDEVAT